MREEVIIRENGTKRVIYHFDEPSLTRQEFKDECDLQKIIARFSQSPEGLEALQKASEFVSGRFDDVSEVVDYRTALDQIKRAEEAFMRLPVDLRKRFDHDPAGFLDFVDDPKNVDELRTLGLLNSKVESPVQGASAPISPAG